MKKDNIVVLLTGRGNNTLKDKNVIPILGKPLLAYPSIEALKLNNVNSYFVSSENKKILSEANKLGYKKILRPEEYAKPTSQHVDCLIHAIQEIEKVNGTKPEILVVLLANCATTKSEWIEDCIEIVKKDPSITSVIPIQKNNDHHPFRAKKIDKHGYLEQFAKPACSKLSSNRQDLEPNYFVCHNFWVLNLKNMDKDLSDGQSPWPFMGNKIIPYIVDYSIDIHHIEDIYLTEAWIKKNDMY
tara:strand:- start:325 stop:1053 length:729 start_codon:yes stop_codon:yes gene_type:complete